MSLLLMEEVYMKVFITHKYQGRLQLDSMIHMRHLSLPERPRANQ